MNLHQILKEKIEERFLQPEEQRASFTAIAKEIKDEYNIHLSINAIRKRLSRAFVNKIKGEKLKNKKMQQSAESKETVETDGGRQKSLKYTGRQSITSKEQAIAFFNIDEDEYEIKRFYCKSWDVTNKHGVTYTNYGITLDLTKKEKPTDHAQILKSIQDTIKTINYVPAKSIKNQVNVICLSDIHLGASTNKSKGLINTKDFNSDILIQKVERIISDIKTKFKGRKHVVLLGDLIETFTGLNHINVWKEIDKYGSDAVIAVYELLRWFLESIEAEKVYMVSGNHDRVTVNRDLDVVGSSTNIIAYFLKQSGFDINYHPLVQTAVIDSICYIFTHGHHKLSKQEVAKIILDYGDKAFYTVLVSGHLHSRRIRREYFETEGVLQDASNYRAVTIPPLFTGNLFSETLGYTSSSGYGVFNKAEGLANVNYFDIAV